MISLYSKIETVKITNKKMGIKLNFGMNRQTTVIVACRSNPKPF